MTCYIKHCYYIPRSRKDLLAWFDNYYLNKGQTPKGLRSKRTDELYAIYHSIREKEG